MADSMTRKATHVLLPMSVEDEVQPEDVTEIDVEDPATLPAQRGPPQWCMPWVMGRKDTREEEDEGRDNDGDEDFSPRTLDRKRSQQWLGMLSVDATAVFLVYIVNFMDALGGSISTPILPFYAKEFNATYTQVGQLFSVFALAQMASMPFLSLASDRYGRRAVLLMATFGTGVGAIWQSMATSYESLLLSRIFSGIWSGVASVCQVYLVDVVPSDLRADYMSYLNSSTQASVLFGPSIGAGLSSLGLQAPLYVQAAVSLVLCLIVWAHLPESPEWCRLKTSASLAHQSRCARRQEKETRDVGLGRHATCSVVLGYGIPSFCSMLAQMAIMSMFAIYAEKTFQLGSVHVGFMTTLGAVASVGTNIWVSPQILRRVGENRAILLGFALISCGSFTVTLQPLAVSVLGFMLAYQGLAINSSAIATGAANMTDSKSRATILTGTRMMKSLGAVVGPILSGHLASSNICLPFAAAAGIAMTGFAAQVMAWPLMAYINNLRNEKTTTRKPHARLETSSIVERGTREQIWDLGVYLADVLTSRHYLWVTYNKELKDFLNDCFPPLSTESQEAPREMFDSRRPLRRGRSELSSEARHRIGGSSRLLRHEQSASLYEASQQLQKDEAADCEVVTTHVEQLEEARAHSEQCLAHRLGCREGGLEEANRRPSPAPLVDDSSSPGRSGLTSLPSSACTAGGLGPANNELLVSLPRLLRPSHTAPCKATKL